ncbi:hypothetical protein ABIA30_002271 [Mycobacterium sp. MAA66]|uniref:hypothetical protein n=1 Tax=Mycobacterium sp. MAA66 TaxID=3156297 RepID=UPI003517BBBE
MTSYRIPVERKMNYRRCLAVAAATAGAFAVAAIAPVTQASAMPTGGGSAADTVHDLQARGYHVQINTNTVSPLSQCSVTDVHGLSDSNIDHTGHKIDPSQFTTVYVNAFCRPQG